MFPNLPVTYAALQAMVTDFQAKLAASNVGGEVDTAAFQESRDIVIGALRQIAGYITSLGLTNASDVLSSGFDIIVSGKSPSVPLIQPQFTLSNSVPGQLGVILPAVLNAKAYHVQYATGTGAMVDLAIFPEHARHRHPQHRCGHDLLRPHPGHRRFHALQYVERDRFSHVHLTGKS